MSSLISGTFWACRLANWHCLSSIKLSLLAQRAVIWESLGPHGQNVPDLKYTESRLTRSVVTKLESNFEDWTESLT